MMKISFFLVTCGIFLGLGGSSKAAEVRPNILWLSAEDISPHLGCYGDPHAITPNLDKLAMQGVRYSHAFTTAGVCAPCRSGIITGMYQTSIGTQHMRCNAVLPDSIRPFPMYLREAGYFCSNNSKTDYQFKEPKGSEIWNSVGGKSHWREREDPSQPFFSVFNFTGCHESGIESESKYREVTKDLTPEQRQDPDKLELPPYYPDTPVVREDWKRNYELITAMDAWAGDLLKQLEEDGLLENTIVFFWSDHGVGLPRAKRWLYDSGTRIPLLVHVPEGLRVDGQGAEGTVDAQLVSSIDFGPTVLNLAGVETPDYMQGRAFLGAGLSEPRDYIYGARDRMDERYDIIRSVRDQRYRYIRNYEPLKTYYQYMNTPEKGATMMEIRRVAAEGALPEAAALFTAPRKPVEELYDLESDPHEIHNLASDPAYADRLAEMQKVHLKWVQDTKDTGLIPESELGIRRKAVGSEFAILRQEGGDALNERLGHIAKLASDGPSALPELKEAMSDDDAAVRYWAATGLGNLAQVGETLDAESLVIAKAGLDDSSPCVRVASARALCHAGQPELGLPLLEKEMESEHEWLRLQDIIVLDEIEEMARPALPVMKKALKDQPNKYIIRVANRAVNDLLGTEKTVP